MPAELIPDQPELPDITAECEVTSAESPTATNNCGEQFTGTTHTEFPIASQGTTVIVWTYDDGSGNTLTQEQNVVIDDITPPIIISPASDIIQCDAPSDPAATGAATATDNCDDDPIITFADLVTTGECANESVITRTWTAVDAYGNSASTIQINTVLDDVAPIISAIK